MVFIQSACYVFFPPFTYRNYLVCGQTYSRKVDVDSLTSLASLGATVHKVSLKPFV